MLCVENNHIQVYTVLIVVKITVDRYTNFGFHQKCDRKCGSQREDDELLVQNQSGKLQLFADKSRDHNYIVEIYFIQYVK